MSLRELMSAIVGRYGIIDEKVLSAIKNCADIEAKDEKTGQTALLYAAMCGYADIVQLLLNNGADVNAKDNDGSTALMDAAIEGRTAIVQALLDKGADVNAKNNAGWTALSRAMLDDHTDIVKILLQAGAKD